MAYRLWNGAPPMGYIRFTLRMALIFAALFVCIPFYYVWRLLRLSNPWPRTFLKIAAFGCGARVKIVGTPIKRDVFFISNHISWVDIAILGGHSGTAFVSKEEIGNWPIIGWLCKLNDTVFVSRSDRMGIARQINQLRDALEETWAITIFPEGTTTDGSTLLPFKAPLLKVLEPPPPGIIVQPIFLNYGENAFEIGWTGEESAPSNAWRLLTRRGSFLVEVHFLEPFDPDHHAGRKKIAAEARRRIAEPLSASLGGKPIV
ncbi:MAG: 1-acyl-sn-glycerol-3-phosphate acyltransferase [Sphingomonadales bacterium CG_4_10_14_3_um_filter_58_15]|nr:MAG: 1-acyl-sn-glycerol-3-phosphate acyltransferase [Sphingomonadales bacterium CG_4_10_14_3_um_filter_58_15]